MPSRQQNQPERVKLFWRAPKSRLPCAARPVPPDRGPPDIPKCLRSLTSKFVRRNRHQQTNSPTVEAQPPCPQKLSLGSRASCPQKLIADR